MYDRLFPTKFMRRAVIVLAVLALLWYLAVVFVVFFQCNPIPRAWGATNKGSCVDHYTYYTGLASETPLAFSLALVHALD